MGTPSRARQRTIALLTVSALGAGAAIGLTAAPAAAAVAAPTDLKTAGQPCATSEPGPYLSPTRLNDAHAVVLRGTFDRTGQGTGLQADFQVWDVADPEHPQQWLRGIGEQSNEVYVQLEDEAKQLDGVTYAWRVRVLDGADASRWSGTCYFTVDRSGGPAPTVTSPEYPAGSWDNANGAIGVPGVFTLTSASDDTVSYRYRFYSSELYNEYVESMVDASELGGPATVGWTPRAAGYHSLTVYAVDRAGNSSQAVHYEFHVKETRPSIFSSAYPDWDSNLAYNVGVPGAFEFRASVADTASFAWRIDGDGPSGSVPAGVDGKATAMIAPIRAGRQTLYVHSVTRDGATHPDRAYTFVVDNGPKLTGDTDRGVVIGSSLTFHLAPRAPGVEAYLYWPRYLGLEERPIEKTALPARADGTADLTWTATDTRVDGLWVQSRSADGTLSEPRFTSVWVDGASPTVTRTGGVDLGTPATFTARTRMVNAVEYVAVFNGDEATKQVLKAAADGSVTFGFTSTKRGQNYVVVVARNVAGVATEGGVAGWTVTDRPRVTSTEFPEDGTGTLAPGTFTFTPRLPRTAAYEYSVNDSTYTTIAARADGTATLTWTPPATGMYLLNVRGVTADGIRSISTSYGFKVEDLGPPAVSNFKATGGVGSAALSWTLPAITDLDQVIVRRAMGTAPPSSPTAGTAVYAGTGSSATATGLESGTPYTFRVWVKDRSGRYSATAPAVTLIGSETTISSNLTALTYGSAVTVTGTVVRADTRAAITGAPVLLYGRRAGTTTWTLIATATSDSSGKLSYSHTPSWSLDYKWIYGNSTAYGGSESSLHALGVRTNVSAKLSKTSFTLGGSVTLVGNVSPTHAGKTVHLQRYVNGSWSTVTSKALSPSSTYRFIIQPSSKGTYSYRIYQPADTDHLAGYSGTHSFKVN
ncbi:hypothetical protein [Micromonospora sp. NPDC007230]|uniref:hypothetical protein n=1 Tax=Micromonospora sp. NPDC007230 TaxID=3364237 RepID=UPI003677EF96